MYRPVLTAAPSIKPVTLAEVKAQLDIGYSEKDALINGLIAAATTYLDGWTGILGRALCEQTWRQDFDSLVMRCMRLPLFPVISITSVKYKDANGVEQTVNPANYSLLTDELGSYVQFVSTFASPLLYTELPRASVTYLAGYANAGSAPDFTSTVPDAIKQAMFLIIRQWFDNPTSIAFGGTVTPLPFAADALLAPFRRIKF